jgi:hypothetical protein
VAAAFKNWRDKPTATNNPIRGGKKTQAGNARLSASADGEACATM